MGSARESQPVLEVLEEVDFRYPEDREVSYHIPAGLSLARGEGWCIYGVSGSGKSTLMTLLAALRRLASGRIRYRFPGPPESTAEVSPLDWERRAGPHLWRHIGFAFQRPELIRALTVRDNLRLALGEAGRNGASLFDDDEWTKLESSRPWKISGGQVQRLGLMRAFGPHQALVFLDEPTNNLDRRNRGAVADYVRRQRTGRALVVVSHDDDFIQSLGIDQVFTITDQAGAGGETRRRLVRG
jgi:ABC-type lipoprotein export system ATPase subunit